MWYVPTKLSTRITPIQTSFECNRYIGTVKRDDRYDCIRLDIIPRDGSSLHDWRDFQWLKNQLVGEEWEGFEVYPAESELHDECNRYILWCFPKGTLPFGFRCGRDVRTKDNELGRQRAFA